MLAHIAGAPLEETALSLAPVVLAGAAIATARLRRLATHSRMIRPRRIGRHDASERQLRSE